MNYIDTIKRIAKLVAEGKARICFSRPPLQRGKSWVMKMIREELEKRNKAR